jgi:CHAD domain-containing protein
MNMGRPKKEKVAPAEFTVPTNPKDVQSIRDAVYEIEGHLGEIDDRKLQIKSIHEMLEANYNMPKKLVDDMVKAHRKDKYDELIEQNQQFENSYDKIMSLTPTMDQEED